MDFRFKLYNGTVYKSYSVYEADNKNRSCKSCRDKNNCEYNKDSGIEKASCRFYFDSGVEKRIK